MNDTLIIGTRGSPLAMAQTTLVRNLLSAAHPTLTIEVRVIKTSGDLFGDVSLVKAGGKGLFTKEIEDQLLEKKIHLAVHSLKDLPTMLPEGLRVGATPPREDVRDVFIAREAGKPGELPIGARVGTSSLRRRAQLMSRRPDLQIVEVRGNVGTRLRKLTEGENLDAIILAAAGLKRLGLYDERWPMLDVTEMLPAVGQGIIAIETRADDTATIAALAAINDADTMLCGEAERAFLRAAGGGCQLPYGAHATVTGDRLHLVAAKFTPDGSRVWKAELSGAKRDAHKLGEETARKILE
jgi:hydroxymethylbilane synthase